MSSENAFFGKGARPPFQIFQAPFPDDSPCGESYPVPRPTTPQTSLLDPPLCPQNSSEIYVATGRPTTFASFHSQHTATVISSTVLPPCE